MAVYERILCVAFQYKKGKDVKTFSLKQPLRHHHICWKYGHYLNSLRKDGYIETQGFLTNTHRFVNRKEALQIAEARKQIHYKHPNYEELYSEDMWGSSNKSKKMYYKG